MCERERSWVVRRSETAARHRHPIDTSRSTSTITAPAPPEVWRSRKRCARESGPGPVGDVLEELAADIAEDKDTLERVAQLLGVKANPVKMAVARVGEMAARLKLNGQLRGYSPLSRLIEREGLMAGIDAKRSLWASLQIARRPELAEIDFEHLVKRATEQRDRLTPLHRLAAAEALRGDDASRSLIDGPQGPRFACALDANRSQLHPETVSVPYR